MLGGLALWCYALDYRAKAGPSGQRSCRENASLWNQGSRDPWRGERISQGERTQETLVDIARWGRGDAAGPEREEGVVVFADGVEDFVEEGC